MKEKRNKYGHMWVWVEIRPVGRPGRPKRREVTGFLKWLILKLVR